MPNQTAATMVPFRTRRRRFSSGDSRNFSISGKTSSATFFSSEAEWVSRILAAIARPISSRAETAEAVIVSGLSRVKRTARNEIKNAETIARANFSLKNLPAAQVPRKHVMSLSKQLRGFDFYDNFLKKRRFPKPLLNCFFLPKRV